MKTSYIAEQLAEEYCDQYMSSHGGNFCREDLEKAFLQGCKGDKDIPKNYHEFLAYQQGLKSKGVMNVDLQM